MGKGKIVNREEGEEEKLPGNWGKGILRPTRLFLITVKTGIPLNPFSGYPIPDSPGGNRWKTTGNFIYDGRQP